MENKHVYLSGTVVSGLNVASQFTELSWFKAQVRSHLGDDPYPGTLNLSLDLKNQTLLHAILHTHIAVPIEPAPGFCEALFFPINLEFGSQRVHGAVIYPLVPDYPKEKLEIISSVSLKNTLSIVDGVQVQVYFEL